MWTCNHCGKRVYNADPESPPQCRECWHRLKMRDLSADSWTPEFNKSNVRFTLLYVPEWDSAQPWVFAWFKNTCATCEEEYFLPCDKTGKYPKYNHTCGNSNDVKHSMKMAKLNLDMQELQGQAEKLLNSIKTLRMVTAQLTESQEP